MESKEIKFIGMLYYNKYGDCKFVEPNKKVKRKVEKFLNKVEKISRG